MEYKKNANSIILDVGNLNRIAINKISIEISRRIALCILTKICTYLINLFCVWKEQFLLVWNNLFLAWFDSRIEEPSGADLGLGAGGWIGWLATPLLKKRKKLKKIAWQK